MKNKITFKINLTLIVVFFCLSNYLNAQTYIKVRTGYIKHQYKALNKTLLDRDEHDFEKGYMFDIEFGKELGKGNFTYLIGSRLQYNYQALKGTYTIHQWNPSAKISVYAPTLAFTLGIRTKIYKKVSAVFQSDLGIKYTLWYQDNKLRETFIDEHIPINFSMEYELNNKLNLSAGISIRPPGIYKSQTYKYFFGFIKYL